MRCPGVVAVVIPVIIIIIIIMSVLDSPSFCHGRSRRTSSPIAVRVEVMEGACCFGTCGWNSWNGAGGTHGTRGVAVRVELMERAFFDKLRKGRGERPHTGETLHKGRACCL